jgi:hypothetical protein
MSLDQTIWLKFFLAFYLEIYNLLLDKTNYQQVHVQVRSGVIMKENGYFNGLLERQE